MESLQDPMKSENHIY